MFFGVILAKVWFDVYLDINLSKSQYSPSFYSYYIWKFGPYFVLVLVKIMILV